MVSLSSGTLLLILATRRELFKDGGHGLLATKKLVKLCLLRLFCLFKNLINILFRPTFYLVELFVVSYHAAEFLLCVMQQFACMSINFLLRANFMRSRKFTANFICSMQVLGVLYVKRSTKSLLWYILRKNAQNNVYTCRPIQ